MIVDAFAKSVEKSGIKTTVYSLSNRSQWESAIKSVLENENIIFAMPVYVGITPSIFKEFTEQLDSCLTDDIRKILNFSFILQSAFPEVRQRACCEKCLISVTEHMKCNFCGILSHCVFYGLIERGNFDTLSEAYDYFGKRYVESGFNFFFPEVATFNGPEHLTEKQAKKFVQGFNFLCRINAEEKGCTKNLCYNPYKN